MGLADLALGLGVAYGSIPFNAKLSQIMRTMINESVRASAFRANEKGSFPKFNYNKISSSAFFQTTLDSDVKLLVKNYGMRNSRLLSIAPTGSISNVLGVSGGVEPFFMLGYNRTIQSMFEEEKTITVWEKTPRLLARHLGIETMNDLPEWAKITSQNIKIDNRIKVQEIIQTYVDTAISSTFNVSNSANVEDIVNIYLKAYNAGLKGITVFRDNCAKVGILTGTDAKHVDNNPAEAPEIELLESWYTKADASSKDFKTKVHLEGLKTTVSKEELEKCPVCGSHLVKRGGCTKCSNEECWYEKCSI